MRLGHLPMSRHLGMGRHGDDDEALALLVVEWAVSTSWAQGFLRSHRIFSLSGTGVPYPSNRLLQLAS